MMAKKKSLVRKENLEHGDSAAVDVILSTSNQQRG